LVDLFFVSTIDDVKAHGTLPPIADHDGIFASFHSIKTQAKPKSKFIYDYKNADEKGLIKYLNEFNFDLEVFSKPTSEQADAFSKVLIAAREKFIPTKQITIRPTDQPWTNAFTRLLLRRKSRNYLIFKKASISHLNADSYKIGLSETDRCGCGQKETVAHFFVCRNYSAQQEILHSKFNDVLPNYFKNLSNTKKLELFLFGHNLQSEEYDCRNIPLTFAVQRYVLSTKRFSD
jgi:hypothetical protein